MPRIEQGGTIGGVTVAPSVAYSRPTTTRTSKPTGGVLGLPTQEELYAQWQAGQTQLAESSLFGLLAKLPTMIKGAMPVVQQAMPYVTGAIGGLSLASLIGGGGGGGMVVSGGGGGNAVMLGGGDFMINGVVFQGPGEKEPYPGMIAREWKVNNAHFFLLVDGRIAVRSYKTGRVRVYRPAKHIVLSKNPKVRDLIRGAKRVDNLLIKFDARVRKFRSRTRRQYKHRRN